MPELPEVETVARSLRPRLQGRRVGDVWTSGLGLHLARPVDAGALRSMVSGGRLVEVRRRGKYLLVDVEAGDQPAVLMVHLGMSGRLTVAPARAPRPAHTHVVLGLDGDEELRFVDPRRFGQFKVARAASSLPEIAALGPEPLDELTPEDLQHRLSKSRAPIKAFLLDQKHVAGLGNIYVCEALFELGAHPCKPAARLRARAEPMLAAIRLVLERGIANRGTTLRDYVDAAGLAGGNQAALKVYGRQGQPCLRCGGKVKRRVDAGRSTFFCPTCQRR